MFSFRPADWTGICRIVGTRTAFSFVASISLLCILSPVALSSSDSESSASLRPASESYASLRPLPRPTCVGCGDKGDSDAGMQRDQSLSERQMSDCKFPCNCTNKELCKFGVHQIRDGCDCCYMCARQQGDLCNHRDKCDEEKDLYCDFKLDGGLRGLCRSRSGKPCLVMNKTYKDGEEFKPNCSQFCTCQDGKYACSSLCPQELRAPSSVHCRDSHLVSITGRCCREWVCPHSHSLLEPTDPDKYPSNQPSPSDCKIETTAWSGCSETCGTGVSIRMTRDKDCQPMQERRLCIIRPCDPEDRHLTGKNCSATWKEKRPRKLQNGRCESVDPHTPKYCSSCKKHKCCGPVKSKTIEMKFRCPDQKEPVAELFMWIQTCECHKNKACPFLY